MVIQFIVTLIAVLALIGIGKRLRRGAITIVESLVWALVWVGAMVVVWNPAISNRLAAWLGVGRGADAILYSAIVILFYALLKLHARMEQLEHSVSELVKKIALDGLFKKTNREE